MEEVAVKCNSRELRISLGVLRMLTCLFAMTGRAVLNLSTKGGTCADSRVGLKSESE